MSDSDGLMEEIRELREDPTVVFLFDVTVSIMIVVGIGLVLYGVSGIWPPMVAIESGSMEPNINTGDLVFVVSTSNFVPDDVDSRHGVVTHEVGSSEGYEKFGDYGDTIVFRPDGSDQRTPIIHRAMYYVEEGDTWEDTEGEEHTAERDGFVTRGDANSEFDQQQGLSGVVDPDWVQGKAMYRIPKVGSIRLLFPI
ncbi:MAG: hypothetical protein ACOCT0_02680 [Halobacteriota archaeon]